MRKVFLAVLFVCLTCTFSLAFHGMGPGPGIGVSSGDVTAPEVSTATIGTDGTTLTLGMSETVTRSGGTFDVDCTAAGSNLTATYSSGSGSSSLVYTIGTTVNSGDTCNLDYDGAVNGIEDGSGNDLASITDGAITNNSTQGAGGPDVWYYASGLSDTDFGNAVNYVSYQTAGDDVTITTGGTITKVRWKSGTSSGSNVAVIITETDGTKVRCEQFANTSGSPAWHEGTLSSPITGVASSHVYRVLFIPDASTDFYYEGTTGGLYNGSAYDYSTVCSESTITVSDDYQHSVGLYCD